MTDQELIDKVDLRYAGESGSNYEGNLYYCTKVLLRYARWIERARLLQGIKETLEQLNDSWHFGIYMDIENHVIGVKRK